MDYMSYTIFGNTVYSYLYSISIIIFSLILGKLSQLFIKHTFLKLSYKTKYKLDDIIFAELAKISIYVFLVIGLYFASFPLSLAEKVRFYYSKTILILLVFITTVYIISIWNSIVKEILSRVVRESQNDMDDVLLPVIDKTVKGIVIIMVTLMILSDLGFNVLSLVAGLGIGGAAIALASKDFLANLFGAFSIYSDRMFKLGDKIKVQDKEGVVIDIGLRSTKVREDNGNVIIIPNSLMTTTPVENYTYHKKVKKWQDQELITEDHEPPAEPENL